RRARPQLEPIRQQLDELAAGERGIVEVHAGDVAAPFGFERRAKQRRLSRSGFTDEDGHRLCREQTVLQIAQRLAMLRRQEQEFRVGCQLERELAKAVEAQIHGSPYWWSRHTASAAAELRRATSVATLAAAVRRYRARRRSSIDSMTGTSASTGSSQMRTTSSSDPRLASRYSRNRTSKSPSARPAAEPATVMRIRLGLNGRSGTRAGSS